MDTSSRLHGYGMVLLAAVLWGSIGLFYRFLLDVHSLSRLTVVFFRAAIGGGVPLALIAWRRRAWLHLSRRDVLFFLVFGLVGVALFYILYIFAIDLTGMGVAAVLMYTAPAWVAVIAALFLGEPMTRGKGIALTLAFGGAALVARVYDPTVVRLNLVGVLFGLAAGLTYGLYSVFSKVAVRRHHPWTVFALALSFGALCLLPLQSASALRSALSSPTGVVGLALLGLIPTLGAGVCFATGLRWVPVSGASIVATLEPVVAAVLGATFLGETFEAAQLLGGVLIVGAVILLQR